jgi:Peptidase S46.
VLRKLPLFLVALIVAVSVSAGQGMWMPQQIPQLGAELQKLGLKLDPKQFADLTGDPMGAIISLGGCSASFVSPQGLIVTNHHCGFGALQFNSTPQRDLITNGFLAKSMDEELPAGSGSRVFVTTAIEDVTSKITGNIPAKISDRDRAKLIDRRTKQIVAECEKPGGVRCRVASFFEGSQYEKITQIEIRDVRLVYAPPLGIGDFGGEIDNWMWPRHTGDWSFLRAYVGRDGKPARFSKDNVPYQPKHILKVSTSGISEGDLVIVAGYPGRTFRYETAAEVKVAQELRTPMTIRYAKDLIAILENENKRGRGVAIRNASRIKGFANQMKNYEGTMTDFATGRILADRERREARLATFIASTPERTKKYGNVLAGMTRLDELDAPMRQRDFIMGWLSRSSPMLSQAMQLVRLSIERPKKDLDRTIGYQERDLERFAETIDRTQRSIEPQSDRAGLRYILKEAEGLPSDQRIVALDAALSATGKQGADAQIDALLDQLYGNTKIADRDARKTMFNETTAQLKARHDSMIDFATTLMPLILEEQEDEESIAGGRARVQPLYFDAMKEMDERLLAPDANSTLRVTFGPVMGYAPRDGVSYTPQTTILGILQKDTGKEPFDSPKSLLAAARDAKSIARYADPQLGTVPVDFLSACDTTGGNSGSPTLNANGELVGLLFDGNYEGLGSDYLFDPAITRSIHVDVLYMLWVMDEVDHAHNLLREMGLPVQSE